MDVREYLDSKGWKLRLAPGQYQMACPFCTDKARSGGHLYVNREHGAWMCQRCGEKGSFFSLQTRMGDTPDPYHKDLADKRDVWARAVPLLQDELVEQPEVLAYLRDRGLSAKTIGKYQLGYAPKDFIDRMVADGSSIAELKAAGLMVERDNKPYPLFWDRIMIPYFQRGVVIALRGKQIGGNVIQAKDTSIGLFGADNLLGKKEVYICEGEMDAMYLDQLGYPACAIPGAMSFQEHWKPWFEEARRVFVCLDADEAGLQGAFKIKAALGEKARIVDLPVPDTESSTDISEYFQRDGHTRREFDALIAEARGRRVFTYEESLNDTSLQAKDGIKLGMRDLDFAITGLLPGQVVTVLAKTGSGKCLTGDTLVVTASGERRRLDSMVDLPEVLSMDDVGKIVKQRPDRFLTRPVEDVWKVTLRTGREVRATADHRFFDGESWRELQNLNVGDLIATPRVLNVFGNADMDDDELTLIALHLSDGMARSIPEKVFHLPPKQLAKFLGILLSGDGCIDPQGGVSFSSSSEEMIRAVQHLLLRFGVVSTLRLKASQNYELTVVSSTRQEFLDHIGPHIKAERLDSVRGNTNLDILPATSDIYWDEIVSIEYDGREETYCLEMGGHHNFVAADIVVHNTAFVSQVIHNLSMWQPYDKSTEGPGTPTLVLSLEQTKSELATRMKRIAYLHNPYADDAEVSKWYANLRINDENTVPPSDVKVLVDEYIEEVGEPPRMLIVDYLGYWARSFKGSRSKYEQVTEAIMEMKHIAKEYGVSVIAPHQVSRMGDRGQRLELEAARDSGAVEETSDFVLGLYRPFESRGDDGDIPTSWQQRADVRLDILKSRHGNVGKEVRMFWAPYSLAMVSTSAIDLENKIEKEWRAYDQMKTYEEVQDILSGRSWI